MSGAFPFLFASVFFAHDTRRLVLVRSISKAAHASNKGGVTVAGRRPYDWVIASLTSAAVAAGDSDHNNPTAPVTKGAATLVPPSATGWPSEPRLMIPSPGARKPRLPIELPRFQLIHRSASEITRPDRDNPRVAGDGGASKGALIARRRNNDHATS